MKKEDIFVDEVNELNGWMDGWMDRRMNEQIDEVMAGRKSK